MINGILALALFLFQDTWQKIERNQYEDEMKKAGTFFRAEAYSFRYQYASFIGETTASPYETMDGTYKVQNGEFFASIEDQTILQNKDVRVLIDHSIRQIVLTPPQPLNPTELDQLMNKVTLDLTKTFSMRIDAGNTLYRLEYEPGGEFREHILEFDRNMLLKKITTYYTAKRERENPDGTGHWEYPKMELKVHGYTRSCTLNPEEKVSGVVTKDGKKYSGTGKYKKYSITDMTR